MDFTQSLLLLVITTTVVAGNDVTYDIGKSTRLFAGQVYQQLAAKPGNLLISPLSVQTVLGLAQTGAKGSTLEQMARALKLPRDPQHVESLFSAAQASLRKGSPVTLNTANKIYVRGGTQLSSNFKNSAVNFGAEVMNFNPSAQEDTARAINHWVEGKTNHKIRDIVTPDDITPDTAMLMVNALYFKGEWEYPFIEEATRKQDFRLNEVLTVPVDTMQVVGTFGYKEDRQLDATFLEMYYKDADYSMTIILPNQVNGLQNITHNIDRYLALDISNGPYDFGSEVNVKLPKFKIEGKIQFKEVLEQLGMRDAFANVADFEGLTELREQLKISKVVQKTFIDVTESGTEAAAATVVMVVDRIAGGSPPIRFVADHPFLFVLKNRSTGVVLFVGRYTGP